MTSQPRQTYTSVRSPDRAAGAVPTAARRVALGILMALAIAVIVVVILSVV